MRRFGLKKMVRRAENDEEETRFRRGRGEEETGGRGDRVAEKERKK